MATNDILFVATNQFLREDAPAPTPAAPAAPESGEQDLVRRITRRHSSMRPLLLNGTAACIVVVGTRRSWPSWNSHHPSSRVVESCTVLAASTLYNLLVTLRVLPNFADEDDQQHQAEKEPAALHAQQQQPRCVQGSGRAISRMHSTAS